MTIWTPQLDDGIAAPRYRRIATAIGAAISRGDLKPGERLPPQRRLADRLGVTVGTVTRAYAEALHQGLVTSRVGSGTYVCEPESTPPFVIHPRSSEADGIIDMSLSLPPPHPWRVEGLREALREISQDPAALQMAVDYQADIGTEEHRRRLGRWLETLALPHHCGVLAVTQGGQHGIDLALRALTRPGDLVAADALTYPGFIAAARQSHLKPVGVPLDDHGMDVTALARQCQRQAPRLVYVTPDQNNPTGASLSPERREQLVALAREHDFWLIEDAVQYLPPSARGPSLCALAPERTLHIFSTAKVLSGGLRVGTLQVPEPLRERIGAAIRAQSWMVPPLMVEAACRWIAHPQSQALLDWQTEELAERQRMARQRLASHAPQGQPLGSNLWLPLPEGRRSSEVHALLGQRGIRVATPEPFCTGSEPAPQAIRLCLGSAADHASLNHALDVIAEVLEHPGASPWAML
ncbi:aminotransferase-like domain-containing protein [Halomonas sp. V046]|uniref:aminotransferase-like domain-containing protein n=1 Tax=Halomonas sp. V046 TaxID=3459611 RepID=UPI004044C567